MDDSEKKPKHKVDKNVLDLLWKLTNNNSNCRIDASSYILNILQKKQDEADSEGPTKDLDYVVERLVRGLASSRDAARLGFALLLTEILKEMDVVDIESILELMKKHLVFSANQDKRDTIFGHLFAYSAIVRSGKLPDHSHLSFVVVGLYDLWQGKSYILSASYEILKNLFSQISSDKFKESVWPHLEERLATGWEKSTADNLWPLLLCIRMFPEVISESYLKEHWGTNDLFSPDKFENHKIMLKQTSACLPVLHPLCSEFLALLKNKKNIKEIWNAVVDESLYEANLAEKSYVGFEMVKKVLQDNPKKKIIKCVLSTKFCTIFSKSFAHMKHPMYPAAECLAEFLSAFVKQNADPDIQMIILKVFLQPPGSVLSDQIFKRKEVSTIIQNLLPEAVKGYCELLKSVAIIKPSEEEDSNARNKRYQAVVQIGTLISHQIMMSDIEWRLNTINFLFLHSFFNIKIPTSDILHCDVESVEVSAALREAFSNTFYKAVGSLYQRGDHTTPLDQFLHNLQSLIEYMDLLVNASDFVTPIFPIEKIQESWQQMKSIVHKLEKQSKKDGKTNESHAFQALLLELGLHLFCDPDHIPEILEELNICCKKALQARKHPEESIQDDEPSWVGVVVDILLLLLSRSSNPLRTIVTSVFPLFCSFINEDALQQILAVINPEKAEDEAMLVDESGEESEVEFDSGSSSDESDSNEKDNSKVDEQFRKRVKEALGHAAEISDAESIVLSDTEMFKLDDTLAEAFRSRVQAGHTQLNFKDKAMLHFRARCLDLIMVYLKSEPPMHLVLQCVQPVLAAYEYGHKNKHQLPLLHKAVSTLQILTKIKKFQHQDNVEKNVLKEILDTLISKCHKETDLAVAMKLYQVCVFMVLCFRRLEVNKTPKKSRKVPTHMKIYLSALEVFVKSSNSHIFPQFFGVLIETCPDLAWYFIGPCEDYAFDSSVRMYRRTQCLGLIFEALKFSKGQTSITNNEWLEMGNRLFPKAIDTLKEVLSNPSIKPVYQTELLNVIHSCQFIIKEKTNQSLLESQTDLLPLLTEMICKKLTKKGAAVRRKLIVALGGKIPTNVKKTKQTELEDSLPNDSVPNGTGENDSDSVLTDAEEEVVPTEKDNDDESSDLTSEKKEKRKSISKKAKKKKSLDSVSNGFGEEEVNPMGVEEDLQNSFSNVQQKSKRKSKSERTPKKRKSQVDTEAVLDDSN